jgi:hypothetical protein
LGWFSILPVVLGAILAAHNYIVLI